MEVIAVPSTVGTKFKTIVYVSVAATVMILIMF